VGENLYRNRQRDRWPGVYVSGQILEKCWPVAASLKELHSWRRVGSQAA
jgi:hypothetical protein